MVSPVKVLTEICICGRRRRTSSIRLHWGVDSLEDKALLVSLDTLRCSGSCFNIVDRVHRFYLEGESLPGDVLDEDLHPWSSSSVGSSASDGKWVPAKIRRCWSV